MKEEATQSNSTLIIFGIIVLVIIGLGVFAAFALNTSNDSSNTPIAIPQVIEKDGRQYVSVNAKNGFSPKVVTLKADMPVTLSVMTKNTYDCSNYLIIPSLKLSKSLPVSGETPIEIPAQAAGTKITASCGMGHYPLTLNFVAS